MPAPAGRSLKLFFVDGNPEGMQTAEVANWTGHVLMAPRTSIVQAMARPEARHTGVYLLLGERDDLPLAYIGEAESIAERMARHVKEKDWWTKAVLVTSANNALHKANAGYLEARLIEVAKAADRIALDNSSHPAKPSLSEADRSDMEVFLDYLLMVLPALRIDIFTDHTKPSDAKAQQDAAAKGTPFELVSHKHGLKARAVLLDGEFIVQKGSDARSEWGHVGTQGIGYAKLRMDLVRRGVIVPNGTHCTFAEAYAFPSASAAGSVINGRQTNGYVEWKVPGSKTTYKEWEAAQLEAEANR